MSLMVLLITYHHLCQHEAENTKIINTKRAIWPSRFKLKNHRSVIGWPTPADSDTAQLFDKIRSNDELLQWRCVNIEVPSTTVTPPPLKNWRGRSYRTLVMLYTDVDYWNHMHRNIAISSLHPHWWAIAIDVTGDVACDLDRYRLFLIEISTLLPLQRHKWRLIYTWILIFTISHD